MRRWISQTDKPHQNNSIFRELDRSASYSFLKEMHLSSTESETPITDSKENSNFNLKTQKKVTSEIRLIKENLKRTQNNVTFRRYDGLVELVDLFPTLVDMAGLPVLSSCPEDSKDVDVCTEGTSLLPVLDLMWDATAPRVSNTVEIDRLYKQQKVPRKNKFLSPYPNGMQVKKAAFSQYPRPGLEPTIKPDSDQPRMRDTTIMGYSMRTHTYRYTAWLKFNNVTFKPDWNHIIAEELYDHRVDPDENHNICRKKAYRFKKRKLQKEFMKGWKHSLSV